MGQILLLDTHTFIWLDTDKTKLSQAVTQLLANKRNRLLLSVASLWEMAIKIGMGRLHLTGDLETVLNEQIAQNALEILLIAANHAMAIRSLPLIHKDPFDRMLIAQTLAENAVLLSCDRNIHQYPIQVIW